MFTKVFYIILEIIFISILAVMVSPLVLILVEPMLQFLNIPIRIIAGDEISEQFINLGKYLLGYRTIYTTIFLCMIIEKYNIKTRTNELLRKFKKPSKQQMVKPLIH